MGTRTSTHRLAGAASVAALGVGLVGACASYDDHPRSTVSELDAPPTDCGAIKGYGYVTDTLLRKCGGSACHDPGNANGLVVLDPSVAYQNTVGIPSRLLPSMKLVEPGRPSRSFLFRKVTKSQEEACGIDGVPTKQCGAQMPLNEWFALPEEWVEETRLWIACGAKRSGLP